MMSLVKQVKHPHLWQQTITWLTTTSLCAAQFNNQWSQTSESKSPYRKTCGDSSLVISPTNTRVCPLSIGPLAKLFHPLIHGTLNVKASGGKRNSRGAWGKGREGGREEEGRTGALKAEQRCRRRITWAGICLQIVGRRGRREQGSEREKRTHVEGEDLNSHEQNCPPVPFTPPPPSVLCAGNVTGLSTGTPCARLAGCAAGETHPCPLLLNRGSHMEIYKGQRKGNKGRRERASWQCFEGEAKQDRGT